MGTGINVAGVQGSVGDPRSPPPIELPPVGVQPIAPGTGLVTTPGAYVPAGMHATGIGGHSITNPNMETLKHKC